ncbi:alpha-carbonic anhydrase [Daphnia pulex]|uniref:Carbonic anhydrase n=1 Tax=Daphnia pulex TaxID=6669 RepID=E9FXY0_DAPPU|nr:alpha-carbonic anhydrase [Daphnia pulex]|eukprot:EFX88180.1 alpha-carbonic anhydrase [Daphnia pulex]
MIFKISQLIQIFVVSFLLFVELVNGRPFAYHYNLIDSSHHEIDMNVKVESAPDDNIKSGSESLPWNYEDSDNWNKVFDSCNGRYQSPINIDPSKAIKKSSPNLVFGNYDHSWPMNITNDGHTVILDLSTNGKIPFIRGGGLPDEFNFAQLHFHWGGDSGRGSEHLIQSKRFSGELHFVHYNSKYGSFAKATKHKDGVAVLAIFMEIGPTDNNALSHIVGQFGEILKVGQTTRLQTPILLRDLLPVNVQNFYKYTGSLTTPSCQEVVSWTVFESPIVVSEHQLNQFRQLFDKKGRSLYDNYRPIQEDHGRIITYHSGNEIHSEPLQSWEQNILDFFKSSQFDSEQFFKWRPFSHFDKLTNPLEIPNWS